MTDKEMSEIFAMLALAYPNAELFKGAKLVPTIKLWAKAAYDVDYWTGQQAAARLMRKSKFPPTIAEFVEEAKIVTLDTEQEIRSQWDFLKLEIRTYGKEDGIRRYRTIPQGESIIRRLGAENLYTTKNGEQVLNYSGFANACKSLMMLQGNRLMIGATK